ncbi:MAG: cytochrome c biogenesis protein CcsA [Armatimonadota bacterium]
MWLAFLATLASAGLYLCAGWPPKSAASGGGGGSESDKRTGLVYPARFALIVSALMLLAASAQLMLLFLRHDFSYSYVASYSSRDLPLIYLVSSFWAGQEGTFLLWATMVAVIGIWVFRTAGDFEPPVMFFTALTNIALISLMLVRSPFALVPGEPPLDGQGLNPLLQDPWMAVHPPVLFLGFAAVTVPFAYAMAALWRNDYSVWARRVSPWAALSFAALGAGISLGGYWAYTVLGWGGFWGWDPVENSSLVPWLTITAALHALFVVRTKGTWQRTALALCIATFILVFYSTFLTRSGVLSNFSVHSFTDMGINLHLVAWLVFFTVISTAGFLIRLKHIPKSRKPLADTDNRRLSRQTTGGESSEPSPAGVTLESAMYWGVLALILLAVLVLAGTSAPLITGGLAAVRRWIPWLVALPESASNVGTAYYAQVSTPLAVLIVLLIAAVPILAWKPLGSKQVLRRLRIPLATAVAVGITAALWGVKHPALLALVAFAALALTANAAVVLRAPRKVHRLGSYITHVGVGILLIGAVISTMYGSTTRLVLPLGKAKRVGEYSVTYVGMENPPSGGKPKMRIVFTDRKGQSFEAKPLVYPNSRGEYMTEPYVRKYLLHDLYVSATGPPQSSGGGQRLVLSRGDTKEVAGYRVRFERFVAGSMTSDLIQVGVRLQISRGEHNEVLTPMLSVDKESRRTVTPASTKDGALQFSILGISATDAAVMLAVSGKEVGGEPVEVASVDISTKPLINFVWLGTVLILIGGLLSVYRRGKELRSLELTAAALAKPPSKKGRAQTVFVRRGTV